MKRTPLARKTRLKRTSGLRPRSRTKKYVLRGRSLDFMHFIRTQPCAALTIDGHRCDGRMEADHAGRHGMGNKADDMTCIPLCTPAHRARTGSIGGRARGVFKDFTTASLREWLDRKIHFYQDLYTHLVDLGQTPWRTT